MMRYMVEGGGIDSFGLNMPDGMCWQKKFLYICEIKLWFYEELYPDMGSDADYEGDDGMSI